MNVMIGGRNHWCLGGGGSRKACTWRGKGESSGGVGQRGGGIRGGGNSIGRENGP